MESAGYIAYFATTVSYIILGAILAVGWKGKKHGGRLIFAVFAIACWSAFCGFGAYMGVEYALFSLSLETIRNATVIWFLFELLKRLTITPDGYLKDNVSGVLRVLTFSAIAFSLFFDIVRIFSSSIFSINLSVFVFMAHLFSSLVVVVVLEQIFRNTRPDQRWGIKYLIFGFGGIFLFEFYLYANTLLFQQLNSVLWNSRPFIYTVVAPLIAVSAARNPDWSLDVYVSRKVVFHSASIFSAGGYLLLMALAGYYIRVYGGSWGGVAQTVFVFAAIIGLLLIAFSGKARAFLKVFLNKHFFNYKYDYREEWLKFNKVFADEENSKIEVSRRVVMAISEIVDSPAGILWLMKDDGDFHPEVGQNCAAPSDLIIPASSSLINHFIVKSDIIELESEEFSKIGKSSAEAARILSVDESWILIPLFLEDKIIGMVLLKKPRSKRSINWEDNDLLMIAGRQAASYIHQFLVEKQLTISRQFEAYNRLSTFVVHDLKNLAGQLSLLVDNSKKHREKPAFIDDAFETVENAVEKMNHLLEQLRSGVDKNTKGKVDLVAVLTEVVSQKGKREPRPDLNTSEKNVIIYGDRHELLAVFGHLIQNAQDASDKESGFVNVTLDSDKEVAIITIEDNGSGMDEDFIRNRLFTPFDTTKGDSGMGVGVYQAKNYIEKLGGNISVSSEVAKGTVFTVEIPGCLIENGD